MNSKGETTMYIKKKDTSSVRNIVLGFLDWLNEDTEKPDGDGVPDDIDGDDDDNEGEDD